MYYAGSRGGTRVEDGTGGRRKKRFVYSTRDRSPGSVSDKEADHSRVRVMDVSTKAVEEVQKRLPSGRFILIGLMK